jgi:hypothetical protein
MLPINGHEPRNTGPDDQRGVVALIQSPITWGAIGVLVGAIAAVAPVPALRYLFVLTWLIFVGALIRHNVFNGRSRMIQIVGNALLAGIIGICLVWILRVLPLPREASSPAEVVDELCKRSPWLCASPQNPAPTSVVGGEKTCHLKFAASTEAVARLYGRHDIRATPNTRLSIDFQELFYEWKASFSTDRKTSQLSVKINHLTDADIVTVSPAAALSQISDPNPEWFSGFKESARTRPDYYSRLIAITDLAKGDRVTILLRRTFG